MTIRKIPDPKSKDIIRSAPYEYEQPVMRGIGNFPAYISLVWQGLECIKSSPFHSLFDKSVRTHCEENKTGDCQSQIKTFWNEDEPYSMLTLTVTS